MTKYSTKHSKSRQKLSLKNEKKFSYVALSYLNRQLLEVRCSCARINIVTERRYVHRGKITYILNECILPFRTLSLFS